MPIYDYDCAACGRRIELIHGVHAPGPTHCPNCGAGPLRKAISAPAVHFKGSGWAKRDRRATVTPGAPKAPSDAPPASDTDRKDTDSKDSDRKDSDSKDGGDAPGESKTETTGDVGTAGGGKRPAAPTPSTKAGTAAKVD